MERNEYIFTSDWFSDKINNFTFLINHINFMEENFKILEIGSYEGRSTIWMIENIINKTKNGKIYCIDTWKSTINEKEHEYIREQIKEKDILYHIFLYNTKNFANKIHIIREDSRKALKNINEKFDFIYLDCDHRRHRCLEDLILSIVLLKVDGIILIDDYLYKSGNEEDENTPRGAINIFERIYKNYIKLIFLNYQACYKKIKEID